jgi:uroporphyrinogen-III decarboxylase
MPFGTPDEVRKEVRERFKVLGKGGGYIIGVDHSIQKNMPVENIIALFDEAKKCAY